MAAHCQGKICPNYPVPTEFISLKRVRIIRNNPSDCKRYNRGFCIPKKNMKKLGENI